MKFMEYNSALTENELLYQSQVTVHDHMLAAKKAIDKLFGEGYAKNNPKLLAEIVKASVSDFGFAIVALAYQDFSNKRDNLIDQVREAMTTKLQEFLDRTAEAEEGD